MANDWHIEIRDDSTNKLVGEIQNYETAAFVPRFNDVGTWSITTRYRQGWASEYFLSLSQPAIQLRRGGHVIMSGPVQQISRAYDARGDVLTVSGFDDSVWFNRRITLPPLAYAPNLPSTSLAYGNTVNVLGSVDAYAPQSASSIMSQIIQNHLTTNLLGRSVPFLTHTAPSTNFGPRMGYQSRFLSVLTAMQEIGKTVDAGLAPFGTGFDIIAKNTKLFLPKNNGIVFSINGGTMSGYTLTATAPQWNVVYGMGMADDGSNASDGLTATQQNLVMAQNLLAVQQYGMIENFYDRSKDIPSDPTTLSPPQDSAFLMEQSSVELQNGQSAGGYAVTIIDTPQQMFGVHYNVGDVASVIVPGTTWTDVIRDATINFNAGKFVNVVPTIGYPSKLGGSLAQIAAFNRKINRLQN